MQYKILKMDDIPEKLFSIGERRFFRKNEVILNCGDKPDFFYILIKGKVLSISYSNDGSIIYDALILPPNIVGESCIIKNEEISSTFKCLENVEIIKINRNSLMNTLRTDFEITMYLYKITSNKIDTFSLQANKLATLSSEERIAQILLEFAELLGKSVNGKTKINFKITQQFISDLAGVKRITTARIFDKLKHENILEFIDGNYYVNDINLLKRYIL